MAACAPRYGLGANLHTMVYPPGFSSLACVMYSAHALDSASCFSVSMPLTSVRLPLTLLKASSAATAPPGTMHDPPRSTYRMSESIQGKVLNCPLQRMPVSSS